ncbi:flavodoxin domain-containing protein [Campylobacter sp. RM9344]|uniref:Flavodoxin domain-containing protein n=1 Tax=Campylobacter californiensis TaxID=1032243 RepID=A0AAW3ZRY5_9BACT|nr:MULTISPECIES: flavodoxin family protein [unclassified Campylobacter]MBE2984018.1 flavodoxin domain-containing protein [Campylobacter sp. RM6883]MBE2987063.1 flavodoxin domain-containing protein [Campylobacter sp. RM12919]MBE2988961.1 flavodoxin domain-containing protein [Campylobacter sp. RM12920]MBE2995443.1 flavodoxin domain-containing protein [Campylobacter sp. RM6913]MBE3030241.1 flavodoxin domain-containing protein [Campylobacter sp. RM9344]
MKKIVVYSSLTGNTKKVAKAIAGELGCKAVCYSDEAAKNLDDFDFIAVGYYIYKGTIDTNFKRFIQENIKGKNVGLFITLGARADSEHAAKALKDGKKLLEDGQNSVIREFISQGAISQKFIDEIRVVALKTSNKKHYKITSSREARWKEAALHPDTNDIINAKTAFRGIL